MRHWWGIQLVLDLCLEISRLLRSLMLSTYSSPLRFPFLAQYFALKIVMLVNSGEYLLAGDAREAIRPPVLII